MLESYFKRNHTLGDSVPNQQVGTWTISPRRFIQKVTAYGLRRHTCVRPRIWGDG